MRYINEVPKPIKPQVVFEDKKYIEKFDFEGEYQKMMKRIRARLKQTGA